MTSEREFKVRELERLLSEGKITIKEYLDARVEIEKSSSDFQQSEQQQPSAQAMSTVPARFVLLLPNNSFFSFRLIV